MPRRSSRSPRRPRTRTAGSFPATRGPSTPCTHRPTAPPACGSPPRTRSACVRTPTYFDKPEARRLEFRAPDPSCNPYLSFSACLMAGLDGVINRIEPPTPIDEDLYEGEHRSVKQTPGSLEEVLDALDADRDFLMRGGVLNEAPIKESLGFKRARAKQVALRPHPYEFYLYSDV